MLDNGQIDLKLKTAVEIKQPDHAANVDKAVAIADGQDRQSLDSTQDADMATRVGVCEKQGMAVARLVGRIDGAYLNRTTLDRFSGKAAQRYACRVIAEDAQHERCIGRSEGAFRPFGVANEIEDKGCPQLLIAKWCLLSVGQGQPEQGSTTGGKNAAKEPTTAVHDA